MSIPFIEEEPTEERIEKLRLALSYHWPTYAIFGHPFQSPESYLGSLIAEIFDGSAREGGFDVTFIKDAEKYGIKVGIVQVKDVENLDDWPEDLLSHKCFLPGKANKILSKELIDASNILEKAFETGVTLVKKVKERRELGGLSEQFNLNKSCILYFIRDEKDQFRIVKFPYLFPEPEKLSWTFQDINYNVGKISISSDNTKELVGREDAGNCFTWYIYPKIEKHSRNKLFACAAHMYYYLSPKSAIWISQVLKKDKSYSGTYNVKHNIKLATLKVLEQSIDNNEQERVFQSIFQENPWMFGDEYEKVLDIRKLTAYQQLDFLAVRAIDNFPELIEIKRPLDEPLFRWDESHKSFYHILEVSKAIGQVIGYIEAIDSEHYSIYFHHKLDITKIKAKIIIGRDGDEKQKAALHRLNSYLYRIEIITYDQLIRSIKKTLSYAGHSRSML